MTTTAREPRPGGESAIRRRLPLTLGAVGCTCVAVGYALEWVRQRGGCESGDPSPNTLAASVSLIFLGGCLLGLVGLCMAVFNAMKRHHIMMLELIVPMMSMFAGASLFLFAGSGPGDWFQYCG